MSFLGKNILLLSPCFFGYEKAISKRLKELGAQVFFFDERPGNSVLDRGLVRMKNKFYQQKSFNYYQKILENVQYQSFDFLLLIKGETIPDFFLQQFKEKNPETVLIFYTYDSVVEYPRFLELFPFFHRNFTFDPDDAKKYQINFRPLFFVDQYSNTQNAAEYELVFVGTAHSDRYLVGEKVKKLCDEIKLRTYFYYYAPGKIAFILKKIFDKNLQKFSLKKLSFQKLSHQQINELYAKSIAVLDINKPFQKGLTMRTFEVLASGKKLVTTNADIRNYPFYNNENIFILDRRNLQIDPHFFRTPFQSIDQETLYQMSIDSWLHCLFFEDQDAYWKRSDY